MTSSDVMKVVRMNDNASIPIRKSDDAAGYDLFSACDCIIPSKGRFLVSTDLKIVVPKGCYGRIAPRSGLAVNHFIDVGAGVIDADYRGSVGVLLFNFGDKNFHVSKGDRIAQLICERIFTPMIEEHESLDDTSRGVKAFGSTGR